ncbi:hypothetical protein [Bacillus pseudomycoides]|uniref:hypothetical protein n=1 Tax=Bacillus pseudomycoides TaxID=64104 RepID=UPI000BF8BF2C|nr:hypothetical protein [Bacillus pseudomycoides]PEP55410.1 hypothetical protein CN564_20350 [Bacillus pseudomycoides]PHC85782.1 hypothetical protein COF36_24605 [Bacillus pseudomycoides]
MKRKVLFFTILLIVMLISGCTQGEEKEVNSKNSNIKLENTSFSSKIESTGDRDKLPNATSGGISLGLYNSNGEIETKYNFDIEENQSFKKFLSLGNLIENDRVYKLMLFIDYKQAEFKVDNREASKEFNFKMKAGQTLEIPFEIAPQKKGLHDMLFVIAKYPDNKSLDEDFRKKTDLSNLLFFRFSTVVGGDESLPENIKFNEYGEVKAADNLDGVFMSKTGDFKRWLTEDVSKNETLSFHTKVGNNSNQQSTYALITLMDWEQVNIVGDKSTVFFELPTNTIVDLKTEIPIKKEPGVYDLTPILVHNPFQKSVVTNGQVETAIRVGVNVQK